MKKKLEAELISIAHRILQIKQKSDIITLHQEVQKLYETLSVLRFVEENFGEVKPTIGIDQVKQKIEADFDNLKSGNLIQNEVTEVSNDTANDDASKQHISTEEETVEKVSEVEAEITAEIDSEDSAALEVKQEEGDDLENVTENVKDNQEHPDFETEDTDTIEEAAKEVSQTSEAQQEFEKVEESGAESVFIPSFELAFDPKDQVVDAVPTVSTPQFTFDDLLGKDYSDPVFEKVVQAENNKITAEQESKTAQSTPETVYQPSVEKEKKNFSVNDRLSKGITIGLNDRIAFMKHLFGNSSEDYNRVLSQLITFDTFEEAETFIDEMVKPDYNNWDGKDEYSQRFMEIVERRFS